MQKTTVRAGSNIAFIKYWGVADAAINMPLNSSVSMTLADAHTTTTVEWQTVATRGATGPAEDEVNVNGAPLHGDAARRIVNHLDRIRDLAGVSLRARVSSRNNFPIASGIASSASGFSALTVAACAALDVELTPTRLSSLARLASGSASRSLFGGFVQWDKGTNDESSVARPLFPVEHWKLIDIVAVVSSEPKSVSSEGGHRLAATSPLCEGRVRNAEQALPPVVEAIGRRDLPSLGELIEQDALAMHAVMMTSTPRLIYWLPGSLNIMLAVQRWRDEDGLPAYFTIDAGPNVHVICEPASVDEVSHRLGELPAVEKLITSGPGPGPVELTEHLF